MRGSSWNRDLHLGSPTYYFDQFSSRKPETVFSLFDVELDWNCQHRWVFTPGAVSRWKKLGCVSGTLGLVVLLLTWRRGHFSVVMRTANIYWAVKTCRSLCRVLHVCLISSLPQTCEVSAIIIPVIQVKKQSLERLNSCPQVARWIIYRSGPGTLTCPQSPSVYYIPWLLLGLMFFLRKWEHRMRCPSGCFLAL